MITRRAALFAPWWLAACQRDAPAVVDGGWIGVSHGSGHRLRDAFDVPPAATRRCTVAIVGGGVAGLAAARALLRSGIDDLRLFELEHSAGGNARGHVMAGMACPLGAHYLPLPGPAAHEVSDLLFDFGLLHSVAGRTLADERHLCHSPQERLWLDGDWIDGLLPPAAPGSARLEQYRRFSRLVADAARDLGFAIPSRRAPWTAGHAALDGRTFARWLDEHALTDRGLRWHLDYACRDDYGADSQVVSAWAGLHYFASRHGFQVSGDDGGERDAVFTWPEGNAWLTRRLAAPLGDRLHTGVLVRRVDAGRHEVAVDVQASDGSVTRWTADQVVLALPLHVAVRVLVQPPPALTAAASQVRLAPWLVANLQLHTPLTDKPGAPPSWDNVLFGSTSALGYVDAMHQSTRPAAGATVLTAYWALPGSERQALLELPSAVWMQRVLDDLARAHPDLHSRTARVDLMRYGHAMAIPAPGVRGSAALDLLARPAAAGSRLHFAHADLAAYSIFEEAFTLGDGVGRTVAARLHGAQSVSRRSR
jgi:monoamine oxidase